MSNEVNALIASHKQFLMDPGQQEKLIQVAADPSIVQKIVSVTLMEMVKNPSLAGASKKSVFFAVQKACELGLVAGGGLSKAHLVVYNTKNASGNWEPTAQLQIGYEGYVDLMLRSGEVRSVTTEVVHENDEFKRWITEEGPKLMHVPADDGERGPMKGVYALLIMANGEPKIEYMTKAQMDMVRSKSKSGNSGPWKDFPEQMWRKSVIKRAAKYIRLSPEVTSVIAEDTMFDIGAVSREDSVTNTSKGSAALKKLLAKMENTTNAGSVSGTEEHPEEAGDTAEAPEDVLQG